MNGFISLHRKITDMDSYFNGKFDNIRAWLDLLILANYQERIISVKGIEIKLQPGQLAWSQVSLARRWKWTKCKVNRYLNSYKNEGRIAIQSLKVTTIITIVNWHKYQKTETQNATAPILKQCTDNNIINNKYIYKKEKEEKKTNESILKNNHISVERYLREFKLRNS